MAGVGVALGGKVVSGRSGHVLCLLLEMADGMTLKSRDGVGRDEIRQARVHLPRSNST